MRFIAEPQFAEDFGSASTRLSTSEPLPDIADLDILTDGEAAE